MYNCARIFAYAPEILVVWISAIRNNCDKFHVYAITAIYIYIYIYIYLCISKLSDLLSEHSEKTEYWCMRRIRNLRVYGTEDMVYF